MFKSDPANAHMLEETPAMLLTLLAKDYKILLVRGDEGRSGEEGGRGEGWEEEGRWGEGRGGDGAA